MAIDTDIDIDLPFRDEAVARLKHVPAALLQKADGGSSERTRHNSGVYLQDIPVNPFDGLAAYDHKEAARRGFIKIDLLSSPSVYDDIRDEAHLDALMAREPPWEKLLDPTVLGFISHLSNHMAVVRQVKPRSIEDLAVCLALIRPGKRSLRSAPRGVIDREIWLPTADGYVFKRAHAIAYATSIVVQLNYFAENIWGASP